MNSVTFVILVGLACGVAELFVFGRRTRRLVVSLDWLMTAFLVAYLASYIVGRFT